MQYQDLLSVHNNARAAVGVTNLTWDSSLASFAKSFTETCDIYTSSSLYGDQHGTNINVFAGYVPTGRNCGDAFVEGKSKYNGGPITSTGSYCTDNKASSCAQYTQVLKDTDHVI